MPHGDELSGSRARASRLGIAAACSAGFCTAWNISNVGAVAPSLAVHYGVPLAAIGLLAGSFYLAHATMQLPAGKTSDRFGPRSVALVGLSIVAVFNAVAMAGPTLELGIAARFVVGIGTALGFVGALDYVRAVGGLAVAQGVFGGVGVGGGAVAPAVVPQVYSVAGWRAPFLSASLVALGGIVFLAAAPDVRVPAVRRNATVAAPIGQLVANRRLQRISVVYAGSLGLSIVVGNWIVSLLVQEDGISHATAGLVASLALLAGILTRPLGGWAQQRSARWTRRAVVPSIAAGAAGTFALAAAGPLSLAITGSLLIGLAAGFPFAPALSAAVQTRPDAPATAIGFVNMCGALTILVGVPLLGLAFSLPGGGRTGFIVVALLWGACALAVPGALTEEPAESVAADPAGA
jgi:MFS family permease